MKKEVYAALFSALVNSCVSRYSPSPTLPVSITKISTSQEAQMWLNEVIRYKSDPELHGRDDFWAPCALTYSLKAGDCEDYAICAAALLDGDVDKGYIVYIDNIYTQKAHAVFAYKKNGFWGINSNNFHEYRPATFTTLYDVLKDSLAENYSWYIVFDYSGVDMTNGNQDLKPKLKKIDKGPLR